MRNYKIHAILVIGLGLVLAACTGKTTSIQSAVVTSTPDSCATPGGETSGTCKNVTTVTPLSITPSAIAPSEIAPQQNADSSDLTRTDSQGEVIFEVTPINLDDPGDPLVFDVSLNTHSVDLSMDVAALANLTTNNGLTIQAAQWDAPKGGHHVEGKLTFPITSDEKSLLKSARELTLTIKDVDAPIRKFTWSLAK